MHILKSLLIFVITLFFISCSSDDSTKNEVVVYVSVDQVFSSKILKQFEKETGIKVKAVYDTEATKAIGLEKRLIAEKDSPRADLFWNSEFLRTERLAQAGVLTNIGFDKVEYAKRMGLRGRVLIVNTDLVKKEDYPTSLYDLIDSKYKNKSAICSPYFGTASTHFAALYYQLGETKFLEFIKDLKSNNTALLAGNSVVKDAVGHGKYSIGLVDTDDALVGIEQGLPIKMIYYDQEEEKQGMFSIYQTISMIKGAHNSDNAKVLFNYLLNPKIEKQLIEMNAIQFPLLEKNKDQSLPKLWTISAKDVTKGLKPSIQLMRNYLE